MVGPRWPRPFWPSSRPARFGGHPNRNRRARWSWHARLSSGRCWRRGGACSTSTATATPGRSAAATATIAIPTFTPARSNPGRRHRRRLRRRGRDRSAATAGADGRSARYRPAETSICCSSRSTRCAPITSAATATGGPTSPAIDALAAEGTLFENGWAHAPSTRYSMPAIAAGRWPSAITWDESIWWPRLGPDVRTTAQALHDAGYFTGRDVQLQLLRAGRPPRLRARDGRLPRRARGAARRRQRTDGVARLVVARDDRRRDRVRRGAPRPEVLPLAPLLRSAPLVRDAPRGAALRVVAHRSLRRRDSLHRSALRRGCSRTCARQGCGIARRSSSPAITARGSASTASPSTASISIPPQTKVPFIVRVPGLAPRRVRAPAGHIDIAPTLLNLARGQRSRAFIGRSLIRDLAGPPAADTETRAVFQEVTSERGKKRALVTAHAAPDLERGAQRHDRVLRPHARPRRDPRHLARCRGQAAESGEGPRPDPVTIASLWRGSSGDWSPGWRCRPEPPEKLADAVTRSGGGWPGSGASAGRAARGRASACADTMSAPATPQRGQTVDATVHFTATARLPAGWRLFFHLEGPGGFRNLDHVPVDGSDAARALAPRPADPRIGCGSRSQRTRLPAPTRFTSVPSGAATACPSYRRPWATPPTG